MSSRNIVRPQDVASWNEEHESDLRRLGLDVLIHYFHTNKLCQVKLKHLLRWYIYNWYIDDFAQCIIINDGRISYDVVCLRHNKCYNREFRLGNYVGDVYAGLTIFGGEIVVFAVLTKLWWYSSLIKPLSNCLQIMRTFVLNELLKKMYWRNPNLFEDSLGQNSWVLSTRLNCSRVTWNWARFYLPQILRAKVYLWILNDTNIIAHNSDLPTNRYQINKYFCHNNSARIKEK